MDDSATLEKLINQCKSNDIDARVDALTKLQAECEGGIEIPEPEPVINVLKACLRTSNQHLSASAVALLPVIIPRLISRSPQQTHSSVPSTSSSTSSISGPTTDIATLRQLLMAFLPAGGIIERLGETREKTRDKARETVVLLGPLAFRVSPPSSSIIRKDGKGPETLLAIFERYLKENGLCSKVWRVREQTILALVHIRRNSHNFPIRPYLPILVDALEDTDAHVRDCARQSVVELFSGPGVTDNARADLKKEMSKKGVRKTIVEGVLSKLFVAGGSLPSASEGSENGDGPAKFKQYVPPSIALQSRRTAAAAGSAPTDGGMSRSISHGSVKELSRPGSRAADSKSPTSSADNTGSDVQTVFIASVRDLDLEFTAMKSAFEGKETEHNWALRDQAIQRVRGMIKGEVLVRYQDMFLECLKDGFLKNSLKTLVSLRTTVAANTCFLYCELAAALGLTLDPFCEMLLTHLLRMATLTKKITAQQSQLSISTILKNTSAQPRIILPLLWNTLQEKPVQARNFVLNHIKTYIEVHGSHSKHAIESHGGVEIIEKSVKKALGDPNPAVRESGRLLFWAFERVWSERGNAILASLDATARKQLEKACPDPERAVVLPATPTTTKKASVAAAIAASRARAKAIATAPPTLRHQATSASQAAARALSPPSRRAISPVVLVKDVQASGLSSSKSRQSLSPPVSSRSRIITGSASRSTSSSAVPQAHSRTHSGTSRSSSPSPLSDPPMFRRRTSSPLVAPSQSPTRGSVSRTAMHTVLPTSPPQSVSGRRTPSPQRMQTVGKAGEAPVRQSVAMSMLDGEDDSLLMAAAIPILEDSDDEDESVNLISFSTPYDPERRKINAFTPQPPVTLSSSRKSPSHVRSPLTKSSDSRRTLSNALSSSSIAEAAGPVVEDAMRARAEQAESAAERLLELVDPEEENANMSSIPSVFLVGNGQNAKEVRLKTPSVPTVRTTMTLLVTPMNRNAAILKKAALFQDSPQNAPSPSLMNVLSDKKHESGWWLKRLSGVPLKAGGPSDRISELQHYIRSLENGEASIQDLQKLAHLSAENSIDVPLSPISPGLALLSSASPFDSNCRPLPSLSADLWAKDKLFDKLFKALVAFLDPSRSEEELEYALIVMWELCENQAPCIEGQESDIFNVLLNVRYCNKLNVLEATSTIRDALTARLEPVYGLTTMHASFRVFQALPPPKFSSADVKSTTVAFGLVALGKFILRLPDEVLEEELPRLKATLISALNDKSSLIVRESAAASIIAAQLVLRDETHLFALLDGLADEKKNLLTYLFDKHGARGLTANGPAGMEKLQQEMRRLDSRTSTPPRPNVG